MLYRNFALLVIQHIKLLIHIFKLEVCVFSELSFNEEITKNSIFINIIS